MGPSERNKRRKKSGESCHRKVKEVLSSYCPGETDRSNVNEECQDRPKLRDHNQKIFFSDELYEIYGFKKRQSQAGILLEVST